MRVAVTGATGLIGRQLVASLRERGDEVIALARNAEQASSELGVQAVAWDAIAAPAPADALSHTDAVVHLAGEPVAQRWTETARHRIRGSRVVGTANLVAGIRVANPQPRALISASAAGYYGNRGSERLEETAAPGPADDFLASVCIDWERAADEASSLGLRVVKFRNGVVLARAGGALARMLPPFKLGVGGPVAGGRQYMSWISIDDVVSMYLAALEDEQWSGAVNCAAPDPVTNAEFSRALGRALHRPAFMAVPAFALRLMFGEMASVVLDSQRMIPSRALKLGHEFRHRDLGEALSSVLA